MPVNNISFPNAPLEAMKSLNNMNNNQTMPVQAEKSFGELLKTAINEVNSTQLQSDAATASLVRGDNIDLHNVMISAQKASITLQAALEVRNKAVEAYQEIMRMQM
ncbi:flagellar hook-basal body complex protein FliE [Bacillus sp. FJAT-49754]|uniref:Flagellar hook-basal body complex protein FliE n=2 Tax=Lederbergia citrea TaxID=2833581 RepID=A0A942Z4B9_9BACI|nr:flagellar hook-basal body complex protein FliE [Lederbergia citrea]MBS4221626.1 flagellar hook-basal body complex protein FliE [Lederbergia citrea]